MTNIMLDIETLGTSVGSVVLSAALVRFDDLAYATVNFDQVTQVGAANMTVDPSTQAWWADKPEAWQKATENAVHPYNGLTYLAQWLQWAAPGELWLWCHGASFDAPILGELYDRFGVPKPWQFWAIRDTRTLYDMTRVDYKRYYTGTAHSALDDAVAQVMAAREAYTRLQALPTWQA